MRMLRKLPAVLFSCHFPPNFQPNKFILPPEDLSVKFIPIFCFHRQFMQKRKTFRSSLICKFLPYFAVYPIIDLAQILSYILRIYYVLLQVPHLQQLYALHEIQMHQDMYLLYFQVPGILLMFPYFLNILQTHC